MLLRKRAIQAACKSFKAGQLTLEGLFHKIGYELTGEGIELNYAVKGNLAVVYDRLEVEFFDFDNGVYRDMERIPNKPANINTYKGLGLKGFASGENPTHMLQQIMSYIGGSKAKAVQAAIA